MPKKRKGLAMTSSSCAESVCLVKDFNVVGPTSTFSGPARDSECLKPPSKALSSTFSGPDGTREEKISFSWVHDSVGTRR